MVNCTQRKSWEKKEQRDCIYESNQETYQHLMSELQTKMIKTTDSRSRINKNMFFFLPKCNNNNMGQTKTLHLNFINMDLLIHNFVIVRNV